MSFSRLAALTALACGPLFGGYGYKATVAFTGATSSTQTNITLLFTFSDAKLKTLANGGQIQNTVTRNTYTVPADFVFTDDSTCATLTGSYAWGFDGDYSATAGTGHGWVMISSYTTSGVTPTVCIGNVAVNTWQGGTSPFDTSTKAAYHLSDGTTLSSVDFTGNANNGTITAATATAGKIDGGINFNGTTAYDLLTQASGLPIYSTSGYTVEMWVNGASGQVVGIAFISEAQTSSSNSTFRMQIGATTSKLTVTVRNAAGVSVLNAIQSTTTIFDSNWHHIAWTDSNGTAKLYVDGVADATNYNYTPSGVMTLLYDALGVIYRNGAAVAATFFSGSEDEVRFVAAARSANWIATEYANQLSPPAIGAFIAIVAGGCTLSLLGVGC